MLKLHLAQTVLERAVADVEGRIMEALTPFRAAVILAEITNNRAVFPTAGNLVSWAGLCPRLDESAGHRRSTHTRQVLRGSQPPPCKQPGPPASPSPLPRALSSCHARDVGADRV
jgi:hypothetical protein